MKWFGIRAKRCPQTNRIVGFHRPEHLSYLWMPVVGIASILWMLVRIIPKPMRASYPCMRVAFPLAASFAAWTAGLFSSVFIFKKARVKLMHSQKYLGVFLLLLAFCVGMVTFLTTKDMTYASFYDTEDPFGVNNPIGDPKGIVPGRVVWVHNPHATNEDAKVKYSKGRYYLDENTDQAVVADMVAMAVRQVADAESDEAAWEKIFQYFNENHDKGAVGYQQGETIFIKINAVHAWNVLNDGTRKANHSNVDTSPQIIQALLYQLVHRAGVPQENIYIGDPYTHIVNYYYDKWRAAFPDVHYMDKNGLDGREKYHQSNTYSMHFSDKGTVLKQTKDKYFKEMEDADYLLNVPAMKGHRWGCVTLFGKNFFGANTRSGASHMHPGLHREDYGLPIRGEYGMYRVFVDLLGHENLGGKSLLYLMDALWGCSYEHEPPVKFQTAPFNDDWTSSVIASLDPVAIESVCMDILRAQFPKTESEVEGNYWYPNFPAGDDYLHQTAHMANWPQGIVYDPENDGTPIPSLGVHEHWNSDADMEYSRNLRTGEGIELVKVFQTTAVKEVAAEKPDAFVMHQNYPNPFNPTTTLKYEVPALSRVTLHVYDVAGRQISQLVDETQSAGVYEVKWNGQADDGRYVPSGMYVVQVRMNENGHVSRQSMKMTLAK